MVLTKYELKKKIAEVNKLSSAIPLRSNVSSRVNETVTESNELTLTTKTIEKVQNTKVITSDNTKYELMSPLPCIHWKCMGTPDSSGIITLKKKITGLFIGDKNNSFCIGITGETDEFELRVVIGGNEVRMNNTFLNIVTPHLIKNGLEDKQ